MGIKKFENTPFQSLLKAWLGFGWISKVGLFAAEKTDRYSSRNKRFVPDKGDVFGEFAEKAAGAESRLAASLKTEC